MEIEKYIEKLVVQGEDELWLGIVQQLSQNYKGKYYLLELKKEKNKDLFIIENNFIEPLNKQYNKKDIVNIFKKYKTKTEFKIYRLKNCEMEKKFTLSEILFNL